MIDYIIRNKEWIFSGIGVVIIPLFISCIISKKNIKKDTNNINSVNNNILIGIYNAINIIAIKVQACGNILIGRGNSINIKNSNEK